MSFSLRGSPILPWLQCDQSFFANWSYARFMGISRSCNSAAWSSSFKEVFTRANTRLKGLSLRAIAQELGIVCDTVRNYANAD